LLSGLPLLSSGAGVLGHGGGLQVCRGLVLVICGVLGADIAGSVKHLFRRAGECVGANNVLVLERDGSFLDLRHWLHHVALTAPDVAAASRILAASRRICHWRASQLLGRVQRAAEVRPLLGKIFFKVCLYCHPADLVQAAGLALFGGLPPDRLLPLCVHGSTDLMAGIMKAAQKCLVVDCQA